LERFTILLFEPVESPYAGASGFASVAGGACTLRNDKGEWTLVAPGAVDVPTSTVNLEIECGTRDYAPKRLEIPCSTQGKREAVRQAEYFHNAVTGLLTLGASLVIGGAWSVATADQQVPDAPNPEECRYSWFKAPKLHVMLDRKRNP
jgi:hypothetical protein